MPHEVSSEIIFTECEERPMDRRGKLFARAIVLGEQASRKLRQGASNFCVADNPEVNDEMRVCEDLTNDLPEWAASPLSRLP